LTTAIGTVPRVSSALGRADRIGSWKARWGIGRMTYTVDPGLYALGQPGPDSRVFVTANYKMTFDLLRQALTGFDAWILVLDTHGINVWCAAGKGTFGTEELVGRIEACDLAHIVSHRQLILPQLSGSGVAAHEIKKRSGFRVIYGPVCANDIPAFVSRGLEATPAMRTKTFTILERLVLVPIELCAALKPALLSVCALLILSFLLSGFSWPRTGEYTLIASMAMGSAILAGAVFTPLLLPWLPGRAFSSKGLAAGLVAVVLTILFSQTWYPLSRMEMVVLAFSIPAMTAYLAMNFTGASTFTSLSGVRKEMRWALPLEIAATAAGLVLWIAALLLGG
jgi:acetyl-CoA decarbonylase/synthase complex subunit gamma